MKNQQNNPMLNPSKKHLIISTLTWLCGVTLLVLAMTDFFRDPPFKGDHLMLYLLIAGATVAVSLQYISFFRNRDSTSDSESKK
ncbi:hypothetical protein [Nafulsella turpanensis]|uniref:hypothetical protein n=1 Tax=Nafulsella turpanensis TaxID=1265690 RepID=UPI000348733F|nr:hypothetical protein [Nafulsella turpanensis]